MEHGGAHASQKCMQFTIWNLKILHSPHGCGNLLQVTLLEQGVGWGPMVFPSAPTQVVCPAVGTGTGLGGCWGWMLPYPCGFHLFVEWHLQWTKFAHFTYLSASSISTCYFFTFQVKFRAVLGSSFNFSFPTRNVSTQDQNLIPSVLLHLEGSWSLFCPLGGSYLHTEPLLQSVFWKEIPLGCDASETCLM